MPKIQTSAGEKSEVLSVSKKRPYKKTKFKGDQRGELISRFLDSKTSQDEGVYFYVSFDNTEEFTYNEAKFLKKIVQEKQIKKQEIKIFAYNNKGEIKDFFMKGKDGVSLRAFSRFVVQDGQYLRKKNIKSNFTEQQVNTDIANILISLSTMPVSSTNIEILSTACQIYNQSLFTTTSDCSTTQSGQDFMAFQQATSSMNGNNVGLFSQVNETDGIDALLSLSQCSIN